MGVQEDSLTTLPRISELTDAVVEVQEVEVQSREDHGSVQKDKSEGHQSEKVFFKDYTRIFSYATPWERFFLVVGASASMGAGVTMPLMNIIFGNLVGSFNSFGTSAGQDVNSFSEANNKQTLYFVYLFIAKFCLSYVSKFCFRTVSIRISATLRLTYLKALFTQSIETLDQLPPGQAASTITTAANLLQIGISERLANCLQSIAMIVAAYAVAFKYSWQLTLTCLSVKFFIIVIYGIIVPVQVKLQKSKEYADEKAVSIASEVISSIRMVVACGAEGRVLTKFSSWVTESQKRGLKQSPVLGMQLAPIFFSIYAEFALTFWFGVRLYTWGVITNVSTVLIVLFSVLMAVSALGGIVGPLIDATKAAGAAVTFYKIIDAPAVKTSGLQSPDVATDHDIVFDNVNFAYPSRPHVKVLDDCDIVFEKGKLTAIVGSSGSGKSTIVGLIERWYHLGDDGSSALSPSAPDVLAQVTSDTPVELSGMIRIGRHNIKDLNIRWWRSQIGLVQQEPFLFNDTIYNNVEKGLVGTRFENESELRKREMVEEACKEAYADEFIQRLPQLYDTQVGDSGIKLSGGQRQRIAIARSIIKRPQILIFDEATSAIDVRSERVVQAALDRVAEHRTTITIAHRLSTIRKADKIIVLSRGRVVEQGSHEVLLQNPAGAYYALVNAQQIATSLDDPDLAEPAAQSLQASRNEVSGRTAGSAREPQLYAQRGVVRSFGLLIFEQKSHLPWLGLTLFGAAAIATSFPLQSYLTAQIVSVFTYTGQALVDASSKWSLMFLILALCVGAAYFVMGWGSNSFSIYVSSAYRLEYFNSIARKPIKFFDDAGNSAGSLVARVSGDPAQLQEMTGTNMGFGLVSALSIIGSITIAFAFGWKLALVAVSACLPIIVMSSFYRLRVEVQFEKMNATVFAESSKFAAEAIGAFRTVSSLTLEEMICDRYAVLLQDHLDKALQKAYLSTLVFALSDSIILLCIALVFWYGGRLLLTMEYDVIQFLVIYTAIIQGGESAGQFFSFGPNLAQATAAANRILSFRIGHKDGNADPCSLSEKGDGSEIQFRDVHFTYPTRESPIFCGLDLVIKAGQSAAIVGASGAGKTSIISLLERFYDIQSGSILLDGLDIAELNINDYRRAFSLVAQEALLFQGTIRENILLGVDASTISDEDLYSACRDAEIHTFIMSLPDGYRTDIGSRGVALSGGQRQRISIARALIRNPRILLLDEATSSLDSESEKLVQAAFERAGRGRTMVTVAHRLATVQKADVIFVLGSVGEGMGAKVLEKGTHSELISRRGVYHQMCQSQALDI